MMMLEVVTGTDVVSGILLWSKGRSATTTLATSLQASGIHFCEDARGHEAKETFSSRHSESFEVESFRTCAENSIAPFVLTHVKPEYTSLSATMHTPL